MTLTNHSPTDLDTADIPLEPIIVVDRWHLCEVCGDILEVGTTALETTIGLVHECCEDDARLALAAETELPTATQELRVTGPCTTREKGEPTTGRHWHIEDNGHPIDMQFPTKRAALARLTELARDESGGRP